MRSSFELTLGVLLAVSALGQDPVTLPKGYVGTDMCSGCHFEIHEAFQKNRHWVNETNKTRGWEGRTCEACHGPGQEHADTVDPTKILNPGKAPQALADKSCFACHRNQVTQHGAIQGPHARNQVSCAQCHSVHNMGPDLKPKPPEARGVLASRSRLFEGAANQQAKSQACGACHPSILAQFQRPHHHRVPEGAMTCIDCHNPHGSVQRAAQRMVAANEPSCLRCHADKRGPFTFEHAPVRMEPCQTCHEPHGSANPRMLTRAEVRFQCLECHSNLGAAPSGVIGGVPPAFHDLRNPRYQNCTVCHTKIHGSHSNRSLLR